MSDAEKIKREQDHEIAQQAREHFYKKNYDHVLSALKKLTNNQVSNRKIELNKLVTNYSKSTYRNREEFLDSLEQVFSQYCINVGDTSKLEDIDYSALCYNYAVILYHRHQYHEALKILKRIEETLNAMDALLARKYLLLLIDVHLALHEVDEALKEISKLESYETKDLMKCRSPVRCMNTAIATNKVCCYLSNGSIKLLRKEMKALGNLYSSSNPLLSHLRAHFESIQGNYEKSCKILNSCNESSDSSRDQDVWLPFIYFNNLSVNFYYMRKPNLAVCYMNKAWEKNLTIFNNITDSSNNILPHMGVTKHAEVVYNLGIQSLHCGKAKQAFKVLMQAVEFFPDNPRIWLRIAESCIMLHKKDLDSETVTAQKSKIIQGSVGQGVHRKIFLGTGVHNKPAESEAGCTLADALGYLRNALYLLSPDIGTDQNKSEPASKQRVSGAPCGYLTAEEISSVRCSALTCAAFVSLELEDYVFTIEYAEQLMDQTSATEAQRYCARLYRSEALVALDRIADAVQYLVPEQITGVSCIKKYDAQSGEQPTKDPTVIFTWTPGTLQHGRAIMHYNLAVAHAIREQFDKAQQHMDLSIKDMPQPIPAQLFYLKLYVELMQGNRLVAQSLIKDHFGYISPTKS